MATMIEKQVASAEKEVEKLSARLERAKAKAEKARAKAEKLNAVEYNPIWDTNEEGTIYRKKEYVPFVAAYFDNYSAERDVEEITEALAKANKRLEKLTGKFDEAQEARAEAERVAGIETNWLSAEERQAEYEKWLAQFKAECAKDGVEIERADAAFVSGKTKSGKKFFLAINSGFTERSFHCYTLTINGETIFTSGEFATAYRIIKR